MPLKILFLLIGLLLISSSGCSKADPAARAEKFARAGEYRRAIELYDQVAPFTKDPSIFGNRGSCHSYLGELDEAIRDYETALKLIIERSPRGNDPFLPMIYYNRGHAYERAHKYSLAIDDYETTLSLAPDYPDVANNLAWILATCSVAELRDGKRAVPLAERELSKYPNEPAVLDTLAAAYATAGDFAHAVTTQEKALSKSQPEQKQDFTARLELYRANKIYVDPVQKP